MYTKNGVQLFISSYDRILYGGNDIFVVSKKDKKGLVNTAGKALLPVEYDAIGGVKDGMMTLLKSGKFGLYDVQRRKLLKAEFAKNVIPYSRDILITFSEGSYDLRAWDSKKVSSTRYDMITFWNDTVALVKKDSHWALYHIAGKQNVLENIKSVKIIKDQPEEKLAIVQQENAFGVISNTRGIIIPVAFSDIVNVGSADQPMYFTEKHVEEASVFVVIYYDSNGKLLRREVYEQEDYEKIYCSSTRQQKY